MRFWTYDERACLKRLAPTHKAEDIAKLLGRTPHAVREQATLMKVPLRQRGELRHGTKYPDALVERIRAMHEAGAKPAQISRQTGVPLSSVKSFVYYPNRAEASLALLNARPASAPGPLAGEG